MVSYILLGRVCCWKSAFCDILLEWPLPAGEQTQHAWLRLPAEPHLQVVLVPPTRPLPPLHFQQTAFLRPSSAALTHKSPSSLPGLAQQREVPRAWASPPQISTHQQLLALHLH